MALETFPIPPFYCPIPATKAPGADRITAATLDWLAGSFYGAQRDYLDRVDIGGLACLTAPDGEPGGRQLYADLMFWLFAFDDAVVDESTGSLPAEVTVALLDVVRCLDLPPSAHPHDRPWLVGALCDLLRRLADLATPAEVAGIADGLRKYVLTAVLILNQSGRRPSLDDYVKVRLTDGAMTALLRMLPILGGYRLDPAEAADPRVRACEEITALLVGWDNDIFGHNKEAYRAAWYGYPDRPDALAVLAAERGCTPAEAVPVAIAYRDRVLCRFLRLRDDLTGTASPQLRRYLTALGTWIRGYLEWALVSDRFTDPRNPGHDVAAPALAMPSGWADRPLDDDPGPLPIPTIAWWWD